MKPRMKLMTTGAIGIWRCTDGTTSTYSTDPVKAYNDFKLTKKWNHPELFTSLKDICGLTGIRETTPIWESLIEAYNNFS